MRDFHWEVPNTEAIELEPDELAELQRRRKAARKGRWFTMEEVRELLKQHVADLKSRPPAK